MRISYTTTAIFIIACTGCLFNPECRDYSNDQGERPSVVKLANKVMFESLSKYLLVYGITTAKHVEEDDSLEFEFQVQSRMKNVKVRISPCIIRAPFVLYDGNGILIAGTSGKSCAPGKASPMIALSELNLKSDEEHVFKVKIENYPDYYTNEYTFVVTLKFECLIDGMLKNDSVVVYVK